MALPTRRIGPYEVSALGLGWMNLSPPCGMPPAPEVVERLPLRALDPGVTLFDTAALYGFGANEELVGRVPSPHRRCFALASNCGMRGVERKRVIDDDPHS